MSAEPSSTPLTTVRKRVSVYPLAIPISTITERATQKQIRINTLKLQGDFFTEQLAQYEDIDFFVLSDDEKKKIANELIERILLSEDGTIKIIWKILCRKK